MKNDTQRTRKKEYYLPNAEIKDYNVMVDVKNFFDQPMKENKVTYENIRKIATGQRDDYTTGCLLDYPYFKDSYKIMAVNLSKFAVNSKAIQQTNFRVDLNRIIIQESISFLEKQKKLF